MVQAERTISKMEAVPEMEVGAIEPALGELLRGAREAGGFTREKFAELTRVPLRHLVSLESDRYEMLPPDVYVRAIARKYAEHFLLDYGAILGRLAASRPALGSGRSDSLPENRFGARRESLLKLPRFSLGWHPGALILIAAAVWILLQARALFVPPAIAVDVPDVVRGSLAASEGVRAGAQTAPHAFRFEGKVKWARSIRVNGSPADIRKNGVFSADAMLISGLNKIEVEAINYLGKESRVIKYVMYNP